MTWFPPSCGFIKRNIDSAARGSPGHAAGGGIFRDSFGVFRGCFAAYIGVKLVLHTELFTAILAIEYANSVGWDKLWLECDSKLVLAAFDKVDLVPWDLRSRWIHCIKLCSQMHFSYSHIYREGNLCANRLANYGIDHRVELIRWDHLPLFVRDSFACNHCGFPSFPLFFIVIMGFGQVPLCLLLVFFIYFYKYGLPSMIC